MFLFFFFDVNVLVPEQSDSVPIQRLGHATPTDLASCIDGALDTITLGEVCLSLYVHSPKHTRETSLIP